MNSPLYPRKRSKKQQDTIMIERETSFLSVPRRKRRNNSVDISSKEREPEVQVIETSPLTKQADEILERLQKEVYENPLERDSYFDNDEIEATSVAKETKEEEKDQNLSRIKEVN